MGIYHLPSLCKSSADRNSLLGGVFVPPKAPAEHQQLDDKRQTRPVASWQSAPTACLKLPWRRDLCSVSHNCQGWWLLFMHNRARTWAHNTLRDAGVMVQKRAVFLDNAAARYHPPNCLGRVQIAIGGCAHWSIATHSLSVGEDLQLASGRSRGSLQETSPSSAISRGTEKSSLEPVGSWMASYFVGWPQLGNMFRGNGLTCRHGSIKFGDSGY